MNRAKQQLPLAIAALLIVALLAGCVPPAPVQSVPQQDLPIAGLGVNTTILKDLVVEQDVDINNNLNVDGTSTLVGATTITGALTQTGALAANGGITVDSTAFVVADTSGNVSTAGTLLVTGTSDLRGNVSDGAGDFTVGDNLVVTGTSDLQGNVSDSGGNFTIDDNLAVTGTSGFADTVALTTFLQLNAATPIAVGAGATITPTATYQPLTSAGVVTTSTSKAVADGAAVGTLLILRNANASDAITIDGTGGNVECKADVALGAGDTLTLLWTGSDWNCLSSYDNS